MEKLEKFVGPLGNYGYIDNDGNRVRKRKTKLMEVPNEYLLWAKQKPVEANPSSMRR